jgi:hypothetical protein
MYQNENLSMSSRYFPVIFYAGSRHSATKPVLIPEKCGNIPLPGKRDHNVIPALITTPGNRSFSATGIASQ